MWYWDWGGVGVGTWEGIPLKGPLKKGNGGGIGKGMDCMTMQTCTCHLGSRKA